MIEVIRYSCLAVAAALPLYWPAGISYAAEYRSVAVAAAILYDAPSERGRKMFAVPRGMPLELVLSYGMWSKVRDAEGDLAWIKSGSLRERRHAVAIVPVARVHAAPDDQAVLVFTLAQGVLLEMMGAVRNGWVKVRHRDGESGFIRTNEIWGD